MCASDRIYRKAVAKRQIGADSNFDLNFLHHQYHLITFISQKIIIPDTNM